VDDLGFVGQYRLLKRLAAGGMAEIYLARQEGPAGFTRQLVVKRIHRHLSEDPRFVGMFLDEARLAAQLSHPNIAQVFDFGQADESFFLAMEVVRGADLSRLLSACGKLKLKFPFSIAAGVIAQVCRGLDYAHNATDDSGNNLGVIHRDVSPQNVLVRTDGIVKIVDFGIAKAASSEHHTEAGIVKGKFSYMAPEQFRNADGVDRRTDIYSAGLLLHELITGVRALGSGDVAMANAMQGHFTPIENLRPDTPAGLRAIVTQALQFEPEERFQTALEMSKAIEQHLHEEGEAAGSPEKIAAFVSELQTVSGDSLDSLGTGSVSGPKGTPITHEAPQATRTASRPSQRRVPVPATDLGAVKTSYDRRPSGPQFLESQPTLIKARASLEEDFAEPEAEDLQEEEPAQDEWTGDEPTTIPGTPRRKRWPAVVAALGGAIAAAAVGAIVLRPGLVASARDWISEQAPAAPYQTMPSSAVPAVKVETPSAPHAPDPAPVPQPPPEPPRPESRDPRESVEASTPASRLNSAPPTQRPPRVTSHQKIAAAERPRIARPGKVAAADPPRPAEPVQNQPALLSVNSVPWADVNVAGRPVGRTPVLHASVPAGDQQLTLVNSELGFSWTTRLTLAPGEEHKQTFKLQKGKLAIVVVPWADVTVGKRPLGQTPLPPQDLYEGTYDVVFKNAQLGREEHRRVTVRPNETATVSVNLK
jgi:eukaryotic-like serine/threonine-protein kinase